MTIFILRHGQTELNIQNRRQGQADSELTDKGVEQAISCAEHLRSVLEKYADPKLISSPVKCARTTASIIAKTLSLGDKSYSIANELTAPSYGLWETLNDAEIDKQFPGQRLKRLQNCWSYQIPGGETYEALHQRVDAWLKTYRRSETFIIVTHQAVSRALIGRYLKLSTIDTSKTQHPHDMIYLLKRQKMSVLNV